MSGAMPRAIEHPDAPKPQQVYLKGKWAIRPDGVVLLNNPQINQHTDFTFTDVLPDWHVEKIKEARHRDEVALQVRLEYQARQEDRITIADAATRERIEKSRQEAMEKRATAQQNREAEAAIIGNAQTFEELDTFSQSVFNRKLDKRKSLDTLRHELDALSKSKAA